MKKFNKKYLLVLAVLLIPTTIFALSTVIKGAVNLTREAYVYSADEICWRRRQNL